MVRHRPILAIFSKSVQTIPRKNLLKIGALPNVHPTEKGQNKDGTREALYGIVENGVTTFFNTAEAACGA